MMIYFHSHALSRMRERGIDREYVIETINDPMDVLDVRYGRKAYTKHFKSCEYIIAIDEESNKDLIVVTSLKVNRKRVIRYGFTRV